MKYPKIQTLFKRDDTSNYTIIEGSISKKEFASIDRWLVTEKVDGTNIRILWDGENVFFGGRTEKAKIPAYLLEVLEKTFTVEKFKEVFSNSENVVLFGEGYGNKIQEVGSKYRKDNSFILFDCVINGWWLEKESVDSIAEQLSIKSVPVIGIMTKEDIVKFVKSKPLSLISEDELVMEGIIAKSYPLMLFRDETPVMFKLKVSDYEKLNNKETEK